MRFANLVYAIGKGLLTTIPVMGEVLKSILNEQDREGFEKRLEEQLRRLSPEEQREATRVADRELVSALHLAQAEASHHLLVGQATPKKRFLYLAGRHYAGPERTLELAAKYGFLWRSYHKDTGSLIPHVEKIDVGDVIALGYRSRPNRYRLLAPLVVTSVNANTEAIDTERFAVRPDCPFAWAKDALAKLVEQDYDIDSTFDRFTGLPVKLLKSDVSADIFDREFDSPGQNAIWLSDSVAEKTTKLRKAGEYYVPEEVRTWLANPPVGVGEREARPGSPLVTG